MNPVPAAGPVVKWGRSFAPKLALRIIRLNFYLICSPILGRHYGEISTLFQSQFKVTFTHLPEIKGDFISCPRDRESKRLPVVQHIQSIIAHIWEYPTRGEV